MKKLSETSLLSPSALKSLGETLSNLEVNKIRIPLNLMEESIRAIQKKESRPLKFKVLSDLKDNLVIPVFNPIELANVPVFLPMWSTTYNGKIVTLVNLTQRARLDKSSGEYSIHPKTLFSLLLCGTVFRQIQINEHSLMGSTKLLTSLSKIYSKILTKILDKNFSISANELYLDQIRYLSAKFFLVSVLGKPDSPMISEIAMKSTGSSSSSVIRQVDSLLPTDAFISLDTFVKALSDIYKRMGSLGKRLLAGEVVKAYSAMSYLVLDYAPSLITNVLLAVTSAGLNNEFSYDSVIDKDGISVYSEFARLI